MIYDLSNKSYMQDHIASVCFRSRFELKCFPEHQQALSKGSTHYLNDTIRFNV